jgi:2,4-dienoyl-CoA reductase-like NADH-dependent reductase (Old Yellow Enzyme family)/thioredoxin reductase
MSIKYPHLLSPLKVCNTVLKNRMTAAPATNNFMQGSEPWPTEALITMIANRAKNGAALVTFSGVKGMMSGRKYPPSPRSMGGHFSEFDIYDTHVQHYLSQLSEAVHFYGARVTMEILPSPPPGYDVSSGVPSVAPIPVTGREMPRQMFDQIAETMAKHAFAMKQVGFDGVFLHMSYKASAAGRSLSPLTNKRIDEFGGSLENRCRFPFMICDLIKEQCGKDFLIEASITGVDPTPGGWTIQKSIEFAKLAESHIDMIQIRDADIDPSHPTGFNPEPTPLLKATEAIKKSGAKVAIVAIGGYQDLDVMEDAIADGKADLIAMARSWICDPEYGRKAYEGRNEDVVPCIRCNKCHRSSFADPWASYCSVNPTWGLEHKIERMIAPPTRKKKVAVVGGGPGGMKAALVTAERGHEVTLYEKSGVMGGLLKTSDNVSFKWPVKKFKDYLVRQVKKSNVNVLLNTEATVEMLKNKKYDAVLIGVGSKPIIPDIPGVNGMNVMNVVDVYGKENFLAKDVVIVGGGEVGVETGMHLAEKGHEVTVVEMLDMLAPDATPIHYYSMFKEAWERLPGFHYVLNARCTKISDKGIAYEDKDGKKHEIAAGSVVIAVGMRAKSDEALRLVDPAYECYLIGDCVKAGNIQRVMRSAFSIASTI